jgi:hypothetical protein
MRKLIVSAIVLLAVSITLGAVGFLPWCNSLIPSLFISLSTSLVSIVVALFFIDFIVMNNAKRERDTFLRIGLRTIRFELQMTIELLVEMYKAAADFNQAKGRTNFEAFFDDEYFAQIVFLDFSFKTNHFREDIGQMIWAQHITYQLTNLNSTLSIFQMKYAAYVDEKTLLLIEEIMASPFYKAVLPISSIMKMEQLQFPKDVPLRFLSGSNVIPLFKEYIAGIIRMAEFYNSSAGKESVKIVIHDDIWNTGDTSPPGYARAR